ncbi:MAG TPA: YCF48-related protein [Pyrinomonadaceae bacterium]|nr:YCF48-related protein [Pyrinomonadaceae bacterium]
MRVTFARKILMAGRRAAALAALASAACLASAVASAASQVALSAGWAAERRGEAGKDLNTVFFVDSKRGWAAGDGGLVIHTEDSGRTWARQTVQTTDAVNDLYFRDKTDGYLLAGARIFTTEDGGETWRESARFHAETFGGAEPELYSVRFTSKKRGWIVGSLSRRERVEDSLVLYTEDGGTSWQRQRVPTRSELVNLDFSGDKRGWIVGASGTVLHTRDGGQTWTLQRSGTTADLYNVDFRNEKEGWAVGQRGTILLTGDGGETWAATQSPVKSTLLGVRFANDSDGWAVGRGGTILRSGDGGQTWLQQESKTRQNIYALFVDKNNCWAVGADGLVLQYER